MVENYFFKKAKLLGNAALLRIILNIALGESMKFAARYMDNLRAIQLIQSRLSGTLIRMRFFSIFKIDFMW